MKHLFYAFIYIFAFHFSNHVSWILLIVFVCTILAISKKCLKEDRPGSEPKAACVLTTPSGHLLVEDVTVGSSMPRRQRSLRERTGIDGKLGKLQHTNSMNPNNHLSPSPSVVTRVNAEYSRPVRKCHFGQHVRFMSNDSDARFVEEYQDLNKVGRGQPCTTADHPQNRCKNRFANILPYDQTRVKLISIDGVDGSDYINASYMTGYNSKNEYIVTQGPLLSTRNDFWRMLWEQNVLAIVNLTRCLEKGREKCDQYWPNGADTVQYGEIRVSVLNETRYSFGTIREFKVTFGDSCRTLIHFHFTAWPDFGVPERPQTLVKFVRALRAKIQCPFEGPICVHCSAGVGRSGTMIAVDRILQHIRDHDFLDVYGVVHEMRKERYWMVQTEQQYIFIHHCILCVLENREDEDDQPNSPLIESPISPLPFL